MNKMNPAVDSFFLKAKGWREEMETLRKILLETGLEEELKWGKPCYTFQGNNVAIIQGFKGFCALLFTKGALLKDSKGILQKPGENTQSGRRIPFTSIETVNKSKGAIKAYVKEAIAVEKSGEKVSFKKTAEYAMPDEFKQQLKSHPDLRKAFDALTPGRQRAYLLHFSSAKQSATRMSRVEKCMPSILKGKGLNDY